MKKLMGILLILLVGSMMFIGCSKDTAQEVYFLNFKPEIAEVYETKVAPAFEKENPGYKLKVVTAASGTYEQTLKSEQAKSNPPVIFQTNGPVGLASSKNEAASLEGTDFYKLLADKSMALKLDGVVSAIPYAVEGYGIIYNDAIMRKYFELPNKAVAISSAEEINNFATLKAAPLMTGLNSSTFDFKYNENFKNLMDLYTNNSVTEKTLLGSKSVDDSMAEFALGQCAMVQNGNWAAAQILGTAGNKVAKEDIKFLPLYMGIPGEESAGLCVGTENYLCINKNASPEAQKGADVFLTWLFSSSTGKQLVSNDLMFITPFNSFSASELPSDPLSQQVSLWMNKSGISSVAWTFNAIPSEEWKNAFGSALLSYFEGKTSWNDVVKTAQEQWTSEWNIKNK